MEKFTLDSTIEEIIGRQEGLSPNEGLIKLIGRVIRTLAPDRRWYIDRSVFNDRIDITMSDAWEMRGTSLPLNMGDIGYWIHCVILTLTHHHDWHKGITVGGVTVKPYNWYLGLNLQLEYIKNHPEWTNKIYERAGVLQEIAEIREIIKNASNKSPE